MRDLLLLAASGLAREAAFAAQYEYNIVGILDDDVSLCGSTVAGIPVLGALALAAEFDAALVLCIGSGVGRRAVARRLATLGVGHERYASIIDESVRIPPSCTVGTGSILLAGSVLTTDVSVGNHVVVMPHATLTHDTAIADYVTLAAGVSLGGGVRLGEAAYLGMNASVRERTTIGAAARVGMGSVVVADIPAGETWVGVPAHPMTQAANSSGRSR